MIVALNTGGQTLGTSTTMADGSYVLHIDATGTFVIKGLPVKGLMGVPTPVTVNLTHPGATEMVNLEYDTGIR